MKITFDPTTKLVTWVAEGNEDMNMLKMFAFRRSVTLTLTKVDERQADESSPTFVHSITASIEV